MRSKKCVSLFRIAVCHHEPAHLGLTADCYHLLFRRFRFRSFDAFYKNGLTLMTELVKKKQRHLIKRKNIAPLCNRLLFIQMFYVSALLISFYKHQDRQTIIPLLLFLSVWSSPANCDIPLYLQRKKHYF